MREKEKYSELIGYEGLYMISNHGNIISFKRNKEGKTLKLQTDKDGYKTVFLFKNGTKKNHKVHRLVGLNFVEGYFEGALINHKDSHRSNNYYLNLEWSTCKENIRHSHSKGMSSNKGSKHPSAKINEDDVREIRKSNLKTKELSEKYKIGYASIWAIKNFKNWNHVR